MRQQISRRRALACALESLESRRVLSGVTVMPPQLPLASVDHGHGVATVAILGDPGLDVTTINAASLTLTATPSGGGSAETLALKGTPRVEDINGDGTPDLVMHFARGELKGLTGQITIDVQGTTTVNGTTSGVTDFGSNTLTIFAPGGQHPHGAAGNQHAHSSGHGQHPHGPGPLPVQGQGQGQHPHGSKASQHPHGPGSLPVQGQGSGTGQFSAQGQGSGTGQFSAQGQGSGTGQLSAQGQGSGTVQMPTQGSTHRP